MQLVTRPWISGGIALASAAIVVVTPVTASASAAVHVVDIQLTGDAEDITLDLVRHGQSTDDLNGILGTLPPGAHLTPLGEQQADDVANAVQQEFPNGIDGIYASDLVRTQETADPLAQALGMDVQLLSGLNEIPAGIWEGQPRDLLVEAGYVLPMISWVLGFYFLANPGSINGVQFDEQATNAIETIYNNTVSGDGPTTDVVYSSGGTIAIWTLMNVKNPDIPAIVQSMIASGGPPPNAGQDVIEGNPTDGWTLVSWDGHDVSPTPDLLTGFFVDYRDLVAAPQIALWNVWETIQGGDPNEIWPAVETGFGQVVAALEQFPHAVIDTVTGVLGEAAADGALAAI